MTMGLAAAEARSNDNSAPADTAEKTEEAADGEETADAEATDGEEKYPEGYTPSCRYELWRSSVWLDPG